MADKKISQLTAVSTPLAGTEVLPIVQSGATKKVTALELTGTTVDAFGNVAIANGNLVISTSGKGIDFSATGQAGGMTSELLNDYEEGTWTPLISANGAGAVTFVSTAAVGFYTKIGRQVTIVCEYAYSSIGAVGGNYAFMTGLPFSPTSNTNYSSIIIRQNATDTAAYYAELGNGKIAFLKDNYGGAAGALLGTDFPAAGTVWFTLTYFI